MKYKKVIFGGIAIFLTIVNNSYPATVSTSSLLRNGDFSAGLDLWEELRQGKANIMTINIVKDSPKYPHVLQFKRKIARKTIGKLGIKQDINREVATVSTSLFIKTDVKVIHSSLMSDTLLKGGIYPLTLEIEYLDEQGKIYLWKHGFLYSTPRYKDKGEMVKRNEWHSYTSENLLSLTPKPKIITQIKVYGEGWEFWARIANLQLLEERLSVAEELVTEQKEGDEGTSPLIPLQKEIIVGSSSQEEIKKEEKSALASEEKEPLITNTFVDTDIRQALQDIASQAQVTIIADESVQGVVSMELDNLPLEKALKRILTPSGYLFKKIEDYYLVTSSDPTTPTFLLLSTVERIKPSYLKVDSISNLLPANYAKYIKTDSGENILTVTAPAEIIEEIKEYIKKIDLAPKQILVEVMVTELSEQARRSLGIDWSFQEGKTKVTLLPTTLELKGNYLSVGVSSEAMATIKILAEKGKAKIRATPRILTINGKTANIYMGREEYYSLPGTAYQPASFSKVLSGITLKITPYICSDDEITVSIEPDVSDVTGIGKEGYPVISKRTANTMVRMKNGQTITIGGLIQQKEEHNITKIPVIGSIPLLGFLFRNTQIKSAETEIVIFITPHIID
ncbi:MAG: secretin and TonB N-terminal domain-containing protein [bacterium]